MLRIRIGSLGNSIIKDVYRQVHRMSESKSHVLVW